MSHNLAEPLDADGHGATLTDAPIHPDGAKPLARSIGRVLSAIRSAVPVTATPSRFVSRRAWGARPPQGSLSPLEAVGTTLHWEGPDMGTRGSGVWDHSKCAGYVRSIQNYHLDNQGWTDIAYTALVCPHGYVYEGRGKGRRTAANGTNRGNDNWHAVCGLFGQGDSFTEAAKVGFNNAIVWLGQGQVNGHRDHKPTACPGDKVHNWIRSGRPTQDDRPKPKPVPGHDHGMPTLRQGSKGGPVEDLQGHLNWLYRGRKDVRPLTTDGVFGPATTQRLRDWQRVVRLPVTGVADAHTWNKIHDITKGQRVEG